jgi:hypothetical protein
MDLVRHDAQFVFAKLDEQICADRKAVHQAKVEEDLVRNNLKKTQEELQFLTNTLKEKESERIELEVREKADTDSLVQLNNIVASADPYDEASVSNAHNLIFKLNQALNSKVGRIAVEGTPPRGLAILDRTCPSLPGLESANTRSSATLSPLSPVGGEKVKATTRVSEAKAESKTDNETGTSTSTTNGPGKAEETKAVTSVSVASLLNLAPPKPFLYEKQDIHKAISNKKSVKLAWQGFLTKGVENNLEKAVVSKIETIRNAVSNAYNVREEIKLGGIDMSPNHWHLQVYITSGEQAKVLQTAILLTSPNHAYFWTAESLKGTLEAFFNNPIQVAKETETKLLEIYQASTGDHKRHKRDDASEDEESE